MLRKRLPPLGGPRTTNDICGQCNGPVYPCLWDGVAGYICAACGFFWAEAPPTTETKQEQE